MFGESEEYRQAKRDAHRTHPTNVEAPTLTWHLAFWISRDLPHIDQAAPGHAAAKNHGIDRNVSIDQRSYDTYRTALKDSLDNFLLALCRGLRVSGVGETVSIKPCIQNSYVLFAKVVDEISLISIPHINEGVDQILNSDQRVVTIFFNWKSYPIEIRCEIFTEYFTFTIFTKINNVNQDLHRRLVDLHSAVSSCDSASKRELSEFFYKTFWRDFSAQIASLSGMDKIREAKAFDHIFADFRGVVLTEKDLIEECKEQSKPIENWGEIVSESMLDFVTLKQNYECTASYMLGGRLLYMTDLGQQQQVVSGERVPVVYLACVRTNSEPAPNESTSAIKKWQLGRVIDRVHVLGTVRLAALKDLSLIRAASHALAAIDVPIRAARLNMTAKSVGKARRHFNQIAVEFSSSDKLKVGLQYRIERSRSYVAQFENNIEPLGIQEVKGFQRYDFFVKSRMGARFDYIDRVGRRYERTSNALSLLDQEYLAKKLDENGENLVDLQKYGEFILIALLVPYYLVSFMHHVIGEDHLRNGDKHASFSRSAIIISFACFFAAALKFYGMSSNLSFIKIGKFLFMVLAYILIAVILMIVTDSFDALVANLCPTIPPVNHIKGCWGLPRNMLTNRSFRLTRPTDPAHIRAGSVGRAAAPGSRSGRKVRAPWRDGAG